MGTVRPCKVAVFEQLLSKGNVFVHLCPKARGVLVPQWLRFQDQLVLEVGLRMTIPIPDLVANDTGISCTLSFSRSPNRCVMPWSSIFALVGQEGRGMIWQEDMPASIQAELSGAIAKSRAKHVRQRPKLADVSAKSDQTRPAKRAEFERLLSSGEVHLHFDVRCSGIDVHVDAKDGDRGVFVFGRHHPAPELNVDDDGVSALVTYDRERRAVFVPWEAVFAISDDRGAAMEWPEDMPQRILDAKAARIAKRRSAFRVV